MRFGSIYYGLTVYVFNELVIEKFIRGVCHFVLCTVLVSSMDATWFGYTSKCYFT